MEHHKTYKTQLCGQAERGNKIIIGRKKCEIVSVSDEKRNVMSHRRKKNFSSFLKIFIMEMIFSRNIL